MQQQYQGNFTGGRGGAPGAVAWAPPATREQFITKTYAHVFGAVLLFTAIEVVLFNTGIAERIAAPLMGNWLLVLGGFMLTSWLASRAAHRSSNLGTQYLALAAFVAVEAVIFVPLLMIANLYAPGAISSAAITTVAGFGALTGIAFWTRKDFSFLGAVLKWAGLCALGLIVAAVIFNFQLGILFSIGMVGFAGAAILYDTSNVIHHYPADRYVGAALQLFASVALLFWYILRIFIASRD